MHDTLQGHGQDAQLITTGLAFFASALIAGLVILLMSGEQLLVISHLVIALSGLFLVLLGILRPWLNLPDTGLLLVVVLIICAAFAQWGASLWVIWSNQGTPVGAGIRDAMRQISLFTTAAITVGVGFTLLALRLRPRGWQPAAAVSPHQSPAEKRPGE